MVSVARAWLPAEGWKLDDKDIELIRQFAASIDVELTPEAEARLVAHALAMLEWNARANLTAIRAPRDIAVKHIADSIACLKALDRVELARSRVIDVGSGAGYPGIPLRIVAAPASMVLLEATARKTEFLSHFVAESGLDRVIVLTDRAETLARLPDHRESYDVVLARAVAEIAVLIELALPLLRIGGLLVAYKSRDLEEEMRLAAMALRELAGEVVRIVSYELPEVAEPRALVVVQKLGPTPTRYPRRPGIPAKRPLLK
jgi:16S rRNA (guanine527-N7)-methyltransferase